MSFFCWDKCIYHRFDRSVQDVGSCHRNSIMTDVPFSFSTDLTHFQKKWLFSSITIECASTWKVLVLFMSMISWHAFFTPNFRYLVWRNTPIRISSMFSSLHKRICESLPKKTALFQLHYHVTLPETNFFAPENWWLEYDPFHLGKPIFRGVCC